MFVPFLFTAKLVEEEAGVEGRIFPPP